MIKNFFNISAPYQFDFNDIRCALTLFNVIMIMTFGLSIAYIGLAIAIFGFIRDMICEERRVNSTIQHFSIILLNCYFVSIM